MKWNWGKGIVLGMLAFMGFILYMVITMSVDKNYSHDLVTEEYYAKEMVYQTEIDAEKNLNGLNEKISGQKTEDGWLLKFPTELTNENSTGKIALYRPSNQKLDFEIPMELTNSQVMIPKKNLIDGRWNITIDFQYEGKNYLYKKEIVY